MGKTAVSSDLNQEIAGCLRPMVAQLPEKYREAIQFVELDGMSQRGMSKQLHLSVSGGKSRVQRGRQQLKDTLLACCHVEFDHVGNVLGFENKNNQCQFCQQ